MTNKSPIRILHVTFNMGIGGTEQVIRQLVNSLPKAEFESQVICIDGEVGEIGKLLQGDGINVTCVKRRPGFDWKLVKNLKKTVGVLGIDIVHCHQYTPYLYGWLAAFGTKARVVFTEHGRFYPDRYRYKAVLINPVIARLTDRIVAISKATKHALKKYEFIPASKVDVIYNGIEALEPDQQSVIDVRLNLGIPPDTVIVGTVSRLDPVKNQQMMLKAFKSFLQDCPSAKLLVVGDGPERQSLQRLSNELGIDTHTIFTGFITQPAAYLASMDIFLLSSFTEGTSMTLLEAMSLGIPAVVTDVGGNPEIVEDGKTGRIVPSDHLVAFAAAMVEIASNPDLHAQLANCSKDTFETRFSIHQMTDAYAGHYRQLKRMC